MLLLLLAGFALVHSATGKFEINHGICKEPGFIRDPTNCKKFIICVETKSGIHQFGSMSCPAGEAFCKELAMCLPQEEVIDCPVTNVTRTKRQAAPSQRQCSGAGATCLSCDTQGVCGLQNGEWTVQRRIRCSDFGDYVCLPGTSGCTRRTSDTTAGCGPTEGAGGAFECLQPGMFPDPNDCKAYHICLNDLSYAKDSCVTEYDPVTQSCDQPIEKPDESGNSAAPPAPAKCAQSPKCTVDGPHMFASERARQYYYVCVPLPPKGNGNGNGQIKFNIALAKCPDLQEFDNNLQRCEYKCPAGETRMALAGECRTYLDCTSAPPVKKQCPEGLGFSASSKTCTNQEIVRECATAITTTTPKPTPTPVDPPPPGPGTDTSGLCTKEGRISNPNNCRGYINCRKGTDGVIRPRYYSCHLFKRFSKKLGRCVKGWCKD